MIVTFAFAQMKSTHLSTSSPVSESTYEVKPPVTAMFSVVVLITVVQVQVQISPTSMMPLLFVSPP